MRNNILFGLAVVIVALSVGYYFGFYLPAKNDTENLFSKKQYCEEIGNKYLLQEEKDRNYTEGGISNITGNGQYTYSKELNTCLYANNIQIITPEIYKTEYFIIDLATNVKMASWNKWDKGCDDCSTNSFSVETQATYQELYNKNFLAK